MLERFDDQAFIGSACNESRTGVTAGQETFAGVEDEAAFLFFVSAVAFVAVLNECGADFGFEERVFLLRCFCGGGENDRGESDPNGEAFSGEVGLFHARRPLTMFP